MRSEVLVFLIPICFFQSCATSDDNSRQKEENSVTISDRREQATIRSNKHQDRPLSIDVGEKDIDLEDIEEGLEKAIDITKDIMTIGTGIAETRRRKDSLKRFNREKTFVYQLGVPCKSKKQILDAYENLSDKENIYVFKKGLRKYMLVKFLDNEDNSERELEEYKALHALEVKGEIKKIDLMLECGKRKELRLTRLLRKRKRDIELDCLSCR